MQNNQDDLFNQKKMNKPQGLGDLMQQYSVQLDKPRYISKEFQSYGLKLANEMNEPQKKSLYIKLAKTVDRSVLERARSFVSDAPNVRNKGRLFLWAVNKLKKGEPLKGGAC